MMVSAHSDVGTLQLVLLKHARDAFISADKIAAEWRSLNYHEAPDFGAAIDEYDFLLATIEEAGAEVVWAPPDPSLALDSIYVRDAAVITDHGAVLCAMGKAARAAEPQALADVLEGSGVDVLGRISGAGKLEGGDVAWLPGNRLAVGCGYRTNDEGIRQLRELVGESVEEFVVVPLPHWKGPGDVFHLMSIVSPVGGSAALVFAPLLPVPFLQWLMDRGIDLIEVPEDEFERMACNVLALTPDLCVMLDGNPETRNRLEKKGIEVRVYKGREISRKGEGGPTCLTRPLVRQQ